MANKHVWTLFMTPDRVPLPKTEAMFSKCYKTMPFPVLLHDKNIFFTSTAADVLDSGNVM